jgi:hypothetical protein
VEWRIFFIGPMPSGDAEHFDKMVAAVVAELQESGYQAPEEAEHRLTGGDAVSSLILTQGSDTITLVKPHDLFSSSSISVNVFDAIDDSDLVIADLTDVRPAVVYEVAFSHALGIWTLLLSSDSDRDSDLMFYFRPYRHVRVNFTLEDIRSQEFRDALQTWLAKRSKRFDSHNPFTDFYDAPIPDISAASGLANSYYENFLRRVLATNSRLVVASDGRESAERVITGVLIVKPENLRSLPDLVDYTEDALRGAFADKFRRGERGKVYVDTKGFGDRTCEFVVDTWLIDVPRTVLTLERSPRLKRASARGGPTVAAVNQPAQDHLSGVLITRFLEGARAALQADGDIKRIRDRFFYGSPEEIVRFLQLPSDQRPTVWD